MSPASPRRPLARVLAAAAFVALGAVLSGCMSTPGGNPASPPAVYAGTWLGKDSTGKVPKLAQTLGDPATSGQGSWPPIIDVTPSSYDFDGDGHDEVMVQGRDSNVYVYSTLNGKELARLAMTLPKGWFTESVLNSVSVAELKPGDGPSILAASHAAYISAWHFDKKGSTKDAFHFTKSWDVHVDQCNDYPSMDAHVAAATFTKDGAKQTLVLAQTEEEGMYAFDADGKPAWHYCWGGGNASPLLADLDGDGVDEAIFAGDQGLVTVIRPSDGAIQWSYDAAKAGISPASISVEPTVAQLDGIGQKEILFTTRVVTGRTPADYNTSHMAIFAVNKDGLVWMTQPQWANPLSYTHLVVRDVDSDGVPDVFGMDWNTIGHKPGNWERLGPAHAFRLTNMGAEVWHHDIDAWWSNKDIQVADVDGDGRMDVVVNGPRSGVDGLFRLDSATGAEQGFLSVPDWQIMRSPLVTDVDHDGTTDLVFPARPTDNSVEHGAVIVVNLGEPVDRAVAA